MDESPHQPEPNEQTRFLAKGMRYMSVASQFAIMLGLFGYLGVKADDRYGSSPWGVLSGILVGMSLGLWTMLRQLAKLDNMK